MNKYIDFSDEVKKAIDEHIPIVAIETKAYDYSKRRTGCRGCKVLILS